MAFENLAEEIAEMFGGLVPDRDVSIPSADVFERLSWHPGVGDKGFRIFKYRNHNSADYVETPARKKYKVQHRLRMEALDIRERLLAGERKFIGGKGRPPTRWIKVAKELGIELPRAASTTKDRSSTAPDSRPAKE